VPISRWLSPKINSHVQVITMTHNGNLQCVYTTSTVSLFTVRSVITAVAETTHCHAKQQRMRTLAAAFTSTAYPTHSQPPGDGGRRCLW
jgi:hypothetical protein